MITDDQVARGLAALYDVWEYDPENAEAHVRAVLAATTRETTRGIDDLFQAYCDARQLTFLNHNPSGRKVAEEATEYAIEVAAGNWTEARHELADVVLAACRQARLLGVTIEECIAAKTELDRGRTAWPRP